MAHCWRSHSSRSASIHPASAGCWALPSIRTSRRNGFVYVYYTTAASPIHNRVSRFTASASNPDVVAAGSEVQLLNLPSLSSATNHNGGAIHFGTDGKLYIAVGDNANSANSPVLTHDAGQVSAHQRRRLDPRGQSVCKPDQRHQPGDLGARSAQSFQLRDRPQQRPHPSQRRRPGQWEEVNHGSRRLELRLAADRGPQSAGRRRRALSDSHVPECRLELRDYRRSLLSTGDGELPGRIRRPLLLRRLLRRLHPHAEPAELHQRRRASRPASTRWSTFKLRRTVRCTTWRAAAAKCFACGSPRTRRRASRRIRRTGRYPQVNRRASRRRLGYGAAALSVATQWCEHRRCYVRRRTRSSPRLQPTMARHSAPS